MPDQAVSTVHLLRVNAVQLAHSLAQIAFHCLHHQVIVIGHLAVRVHDEMAARAHRAKHLEPGLAVTTIGKDRAAPISTRRHVVKRTGVFESEGPCHRSTLAGATGATREHIN